MKKLVILLMSCFLLTGCGQNNHELDKFQEEVNDFCDKIVEIDTAMNKISNVTADEAGLEVATTELLNNLELLKDEFVKFSNVDFPEEYDYLEDLADEASDYMSEAFNSYKKTYKENYTESMEEYARENYSRAYKRIQVIVDSLQGKYPNTN